jgi:hypothetical protein
MKDSIFHRFIVGQQRNDRRLRWPFWKIELGALAQIGMRLKRATAERSDDLRHQRGMAEQRSSSPPV